MGRQPDGRIIFGGKFWSAIALATFGAVCWFAYSEHAQAGVRPFPPPRSGREWQIVVIGSATCAASNHPEIRAAISRVISSLRHQVESAGEQFSTVGVAVDWDHTAGWKFLRQFGDFDEISLGKNWLSQMATKYIWRELPGPGMVPQLLIVTRTIQVVRGGYVVADDSVIKRLSGGREILEYDQWLSGVKPNRRPASLPNPSTPAEPVGEVPE